MKKKEKDNKIIKILKSLSDSNIDQIFNKFYKISHHNKEKNKKNNMSNEITSTIISSGDVENEYEEIREPTQQSREGENNIENENNNNNNNDTNVTNINYILKETCNLRKRKRITTEDNIEDDDNEEDLINVCQFKKKKIINDKNKDNCDNNEYINQNNTEEIINTDNWLLKNITTLDYELPNDSQFDEIDLGKVDYIIDPLFKILDGKKNFSIGDLLSVIYSDRIELNSDEYNFILNMFKMDIPTLLNRYFILFQNLPSNYSLKFEKIIKLSSLLNSIVERKTYNSNCGGINILFDINKPVWNKNFNRIDNILRKGNKFKYHEIKTSDEFKRINKNNIKEYTSLDYIYKGDYSRIREYYKSNKDINRYIFVLYGKLSIFDRKIFPAKLKIS